MQRSVMLVGVVALCLLVAAPVGAETNPAQSPVSSSCPNLSTAEPADTGLLAPVYEIQLGKDFVPPAVQTEATTSPVEECPVLRDCILGNKCGDNHPCQLVGPQVDNDTGLTACVDGPVIKRCPRGQTIHTVTADCGQCRCCSTFPACLCPLDCGTALLKWGCA